MKILLLTAADPLAPRLAYLCQPAAGQDALVLLENPPTDPHKFVSECEKIVLSAGATDPATLARVWKPLLDAAISAKKPIFALGTAALAAAIHSQATIEPLPAPAHALVYTGVVGGGATQTYQNIPREFEACYYQNHRLANKLPDALVFTVKDKLGSVVGFRHRRYALEAVLFHPASLHSPHGAKLLQNWLQTA